MAENAPRYALYVVPDPRTDLYRFGCTSLGYDSYRGCDVDFPIGSPARWAEMVREPRRYGFHATMKAPFRLAPGTREEDLVRAAQLFAEDQPVIAGVSLSLRPVGSFLALVPTHRSDEIGGLAERCVRHFDRFRAAMTADEKDRRLRTQLTPSQTKHLDRWGYPYVFDDFKFHMTLTGPVESTRRAEAEDFLRKHLRRIACDTVLRIDQIAVLRQDEPTARFRVIHRAALGHSAFRPFAYSF